MIDDFESYADSKAVAAAYQRNSSGDSLTLSLDTEHVKNGKAALKYDYSVTDGGAGYCGATKNLGSADWTGFDGIHTDHVGRQQPRNYIPVCGRCRCILGERSESHCRGRLDRGKDPVLRLLCAAMGHCRRNSDTERCERILSTPDRTAIREPVYGISMTSVCTMTVRSRYPMQKQQKQKRPLIAGSEHHLYHYH